MPLASGARLGSYEVTRLLGAGGMGEVYSARDTRLDRTVAIKVLPAEFAADPDRRERFEREARAVAALNHPHICDLYDVGEAPPPAPATASAAPIRFLVMEYLEGQTLADRLQPGALPPAEVLRCAIELADALDHAHRRGLVHRDLKPGNLMLTRSGLKLLDFGLSKLQTTPDLLALSTISPGDAALTAAGAVLGTFPYMSPEQLAGQEADARSDLFAFGAIVYEMATGRRAFEGKTPASVIGAVLHTDPPPVSSLQPLAPPSWDRIVSRCLAKDPDDRWQSARDLVLELKSIGDSKPDATVAGPALARLRRRERAAWVVSGVLFLLLASATGIAVAYLRRTAPEESARRLSLLPPTNVRPADLAAGGGPAISPDGSRVTFVGIGADGKKLLWLRSLDGLEALPLAATEGAEFPFWSPDSRTIGFFAQGKLKKVPADSGPSLTLCDAPQPRGGAWNDEGLILFSANAGERWYHVPAAGGTATPLIIDRPSSENYWPFFLPDGRHFIYFGRPEKPGIYVASLDSKGAKLLLGGEVGVGYAPPGHLLTLAGFKSSESQTLVARPFDATRLEITGEPSVVAEHVAYRTLIARAAFSVSQNGTVVYEAAQRAATQLMWFDRKGTKLSALGEPVGYRRPSLSPDGKTVAVERPDRNGEATDIWLLETSRGVASRLTIDPNPDWSPIWSPDGSRLVFSSPRGSAPELYQQDSHTAGSGALLLKGSRVVHPGDWSKDGRFLVYTVLDPKTRWDLGILPMLGSSGADPKPEPFLQTEFNEQAGQFSPDGRWLAYVSDESGATDIYVGPFPAAAGGRWRISASGGLQPRWRADGKELFYIAPDGALMAATVTDRPAFQADTPRRLFETRIAEDVEASWNYDVTGDGQRFLINSITEDVLPSSITVLLNWRAALVRR